MDCETAGFIMHKNVWMDLLAPKTYGMFEGVIKHA